ncbi:MAG: hypothetical protein LBV23_10205 [Deltaproteobacteria bacterium]|nr:hypothetical protein [Deltaproteobacteria bacterium]
MALLSLEDISAELCTAAGWQKNVTMRSDSVKFELEDGLSFTLKNFDNKTMAFEAPLGLLPEDKVEADELARKLCRLAAAASLRRRSILSLSNGQLALHLIYDTVATPLAQAPLSCAEFLNDLDWWRLNGFSPEN